MNNPNVRSDGETQKQFNERRRSAQKQVRAASYFWYSSQGTYKKPETVIPQFKQTNSRTPKPINKFRGFRRVRQFIPLLNMSIWVRA